MRAVQKLFRQKQSLRSFWVATKKSHMAHGAVQRLCNEFGDEFNATIICENDNICVAGHGALTITMVCNIADYFAIGDQGGILQVYTRAKGRVVRAIVRGPIVWENPDAVHDAISKAVLRASQVDNWTILFYSPTYAERPLCRPDVADAHTRACHVFRCMGEQWKGASKLLCENCRMTTDATVNVLGTKAAQAKSIWQQVDHVVCQMWNCNLHNIVLQYHSGTVTLQATTSEINTYILRLLLQLRKSNLLDLEKSSRLPINQLGNLHIPLKLNRVSYARKPPASSDEEDEVEYSHSHKRPRH